MLALRDHSAGVHLRESWKNFSINVSKEKWSFSFQVGWFEWEEMRRWAPPQLWFIGVEISTTIIKVRIILFKGKFLCLKYFVFLKTVYVISTYLNSSITNWIWFTAEKIGELWSNIICFLFKVFGLSDMKDYLKRKSYLKSHLERWIFS